LLLIAPNSNTAFKTVTRIPTITNNAVRPYSPRAIGLLLVVFILYGTTVQAVHQHGLTLVRTSPTTDSVANAGFDSSLRNTNLGCSDCLICQLHQSFSTTLISIKSGIKPSSTRSTLDSPILDFTASETTAPRTGRAPPKTN